MHATRELQEVIKDNGYGTITLYCIAFQQDFTFSKENPMTGATPHLPLPFKRGIQFALPRLSIAFTHRISY